MPEASLRKALKGLTVQQLKALIRRLHEPDPRGPKAELVDPCRPQHFLYFLPASPGQALNEGHG